MPLKSIFFLQKEKLQFSRSTYCNMIVDHSNPSLRSYFQDVRSRIILDHSSWIPDAANMIKVPGPRSHFQGPWSWASCFTDEIPQFPPIGSWVLCPGSHFSDMLLQSFSYCKRQHFQNKYTINIKYKGDAATLLSSQIKRMCIDGGFSLYTSFRDDVFLVCSRVHRTQTRSIAISS